MYELAKATGSCVSQDDHKLLMVVEIIANRILFSYALFSIASIVRAWWIGGVVIEALSQLEPFLFVATLILQDVGKEASGSSQALESLPTWAQILLAIVPTVITTLGVVFTIRLNNQLTHASAVADSKVPLERRQLELEIAEKEHHLREEGIISQGQEYVHQQILEPLTKPFLESRQIQNLMLRFIILYAFLVLWGWLANTFGFLLSQVFNILQRREIYDPESPLFTIVWPALTYLPNIGHGVIILILGWPLLKATSKVLGFNLRDIFRLRGIPDQSTGTEEDGGV